MQPKWSYLKQSDNFVLKQFPLWVTFYRITCFEQNIDRIGWRENGMRSEVQQRFQCSPVTTHYKLPRANMSKSTVVSKELGLFVFRKLLDNNRYPHYTQMLRWSEMSSVRNQTSNIKDTDCIQCSIRPNWKIYIYSIIESSGQVLSAFR